MSALFLVFTFLVGMFFGALLMAIGIAWEEELREQARRR